MKDFEPKGSLSDSAKIRSRLDEIEQYRFEGHSLISIYRGLKESGYINCCYSNFQRVYYGVKPVHGMKPEKVTQPIDIKPNSSTVDGSNNGSDISSDKPDGIRVDILGSFDRNAAIAQAKATFRNNRKDK